MLLDSNILIYGASGRYKELGHILGRNDLVVASISQIETLGFHNLSDFEDQWLRTVFANIKVISLDAKIIESAITLRRSHRLRLGDSIIAATALAHNHELVSCDVDFKKVEGLKVINPLSVSQ